jgi:hypothetical protein
MNLIKRAAWVDIALGLWLLAAPSVIGYQATRPIAVFEDILPGLFLFVTSVLILTLKARPFRLEWLQALCGLWLMAGSVALIVQHLPGGALNGVLAGVGVFAVSLTVWLLSTPPDSDPRQHHA